MRLKPGPASGESSAVRNILPGTTANSQCHLRAKYLISRSVIGDGLIAHILPSKGSFLPYSSLVRHQHNTLWSLCTFSLFTFVSCHSFQNEVLRSSGSRGHCKPCSSSIWHFREQHHWITRMDLHADRCSIRRWSHSLCFHCSILIRRAFICHQRYRPHHASY